MLGEIIEFANHIETREKLLRELRTAKKKKKKEETKYDLKAKISNIGCIRKRIRKRERKTWQSLRSYIIE